MMELIKDLSFLELFIVNTIVYFDCFDYPLTALEIYHLLYTGGMEGKDFPLDQVQACLEQSPQLQKILATSGGFYFLKNRDQIIETRLQRYRLAEHKYTIAQRAVKFFRFLPFVKLVAVCNSLAYNNARSESDIDLFIITRKNRLWLTRFFLVLIITILGLRPPKNKVKDKICLSFYATEEALDLSGIKIVNDDIYLIYWLASLWPYYERDNFYNQLIKANGWLLKYLPNWQKIIPGYRRRLEDSFWSKKSQQLKEFLYQGKLGDWLEIKAKELQIKKMSQKKKDLAVFNDSRVIISDSMLKLHENDRRLEYLDKFEKKRLEIIKNL